MKYFGVFFLVIALGICLSVVGVALNLITIPWLSFSTKVQANRDIVTKTYNADNQIYNYHWFQERAGSIRATKENSVVACTEHESFIKESGTRDKWSYAQTQEEARLSTVCFGLKAQYQNLVEEYNAKAGEADRSMFVDGLPLFFKL